MESIPATQAFLINWGWLQIGPYIHINIDPVLLRLGPLALHWYGLMYVVALDAGALFAACAQPIGRIGNLINGDIIGYPSRLPWSTVYDNPTSFACANPGTCHVPVQPAAGYEILLNLILIVVLLFVARRSRRPDMLLLTYLYGYAIAQFLVFFGRANSIVPLFTFHWGLKQAQWTSLIVLLVLIPLTLWVRPWRSAQPLPEGEIPAI